MNEEQLRGWITAVDAALASDEDTDLEPLWNELGAAIDAHPDHGPLRRLRIRLAEATWQHGARHADLLALRAIDPGDRAAWLDLALLQHRWAFLLAEDPPSDDVDATAEGESATDARQGALEHEALRWLDSLLEAHGSDAAFCAEVFARWDQAGIYLPWLRLRLVLAACARHPDDLALTRELARAWEELANQAPDGHDTAGPPPMGFLYDVSGMLWDPFLQDHALATLDRLLARTPGDADLLARRARLLEARCAFDDAAAAYEAVRAAAQTAEAAAATDEAREQAAAQAAEMQQRARLCQQGRAALVQDMADGLASVMGQFEATLPAHEETDGTEPSLGAEWRTSIERHAEEIGAGLDALRAAIPSGDGPGDDERERMQGLARQVSSGVLGNLQLAPLDLRPIQPPAFEADWADATRNAHDGLASLGWRMLGWLEWPDFRELIGHQVVSSVWTDPSATSVALVSPVRGGISMDVETELEDGRFVVTTTCRGRNFLSGGPTVDTLFIEPTLAAAEACALHAARVAWVMARQPGAVPRRAADLEAVAAMQERARQHKTRFRLTEGLTRSEALGVPHDYPELFAPMLQQAVREGLASLRSAARL